MAWAPDYITSAELKSYMRIPSDDTVDDSELSIAITAASRAIDQFSNRQFGNTGTAEVRYYTPEMDKDSGLYVISMDDACAVTGTFEVFSDNNNDQTFSYEIDSYRFWPYNAAVRNAPYTRLFVLSDSTSQPRCTVGSVSVNTVWGWASVPVAVKQATLLQASRFLKRRESPFGVAGSPELGNELRLLAKVDPDVAVVLSPYKKQWGVIWR